MLERGILGMKKFRIAAVCAVFLVLSSALIAAKKVYDCYRNVDWSAQSYAESTDVVNNPYRGFYNIYAYYVNDEEGYVHDERTKKGIAESIDERLVLLQFNLNYYKDKRLTDKALNQINHVINSWSEADYDIILRFLYDWDGKAADSEPDDISVIREHMMQISKIVNSYASDIFVMQGIFVGNYAEMNGGSYMDDKSFKELFACLDNLISQDIFLSVRTPAHLRTIYESADIIEIIKKNKRTGLFNDAILGSATDLNTYGQDDIAFDDNNYFKKGSRNQELEFQNDLCSYFPNGGEVIIDNPYNDGSNATDDFSKMHITYLNKMYDENVLNKWKAEIYNGDDIFNGVSVYDYMLSHLGYRYVLKDSFINYETFAKNADLNITIENKGFAPAYRKFDAKIKAYDSDGNSVISCIVKAFNYQDEKVSLPAGGSADITCSIDIGNLLPGEYDFYLEITDSGCDDTIYLANTNEFTQKGYFIGNLNVSKILGK